jgi:hypothetical protein
MTRLPNPLRSLLARGVLALLFVFAQQQATLHWMSHAVAEVTQKAKHAPNEVCEDCGGLIAFGAMAVGAPLPLLLPRAEQVGLDTTPALPLQRAPQLGFRSRAPPLTA